MRCLFSVRLWRHILAVYNRGFRNSYKIEEGANFIVGDPLLFFVAVARKEGQGVDNSAKKY